MHKVYNHPNRPASSGWSEGREVAGASRTLYISGQVGRTDDGIPEGIAEQTKATIANLRAILGQAGMTFENVVKFTIYLTDEADLPDFAKVWYPALPSPPPAVTGVVVGALVNPALRVEIEAIAVA